MDSKIDTFIFDCFGVVYDPILFNWYQENRVDRGFTDPKLLDVFRDFDLGNLSEEDIAEYFSKYEGITSTKKEIQKQIDDYLKLNVKLVTIIKKLKSKGFKTILLSNANSDFFERKIYPTYPEFKNIFDEIIISSDVKMVKPNKDIFLYTLEKCDSKPEEVLFIDDGKTNVDAAIDVGMKGFLYSNNDSFVEYIERLGINLND
jgi:putative hydrolase of the HAD superfamily